MNAQKDSASTSSSADGEVAPAGILPASRLDGLVRVLAERGYRVVAPVVRNRAIVYDDVTTAADLPWGWTDLQEPGSYRLERREDDAAFGYAVGPHSWKRFLFSPERVLWRGRVEDDGHFQVDVPEDDPQPTAFLGVRACEIAAIEIQDRVFLGGRFVDDAYRRRRERNLIIAVNCTTSGKTCFCVSMETGPQARAGFDLALTELLDAERHEFLVECASDHGQALLDDLDLRPASEADFASARDAVASAASSQQRHLATDDVHDLLLGSLEHPNWDAIADRCLACSNCTLVCPTCFCSDVVDVSDLTGREVERRQVWDSCFTADHSYLHGGSVHDSISSRYRQWLTHKLATWIDQFGTSGCVGCGRCITWCPVGIDLTEEVPKFRDDMNGRASGNSGPSPNEPAKTTASS